ncbi:uncharacterized protein LOC116182929 [Photinus pyralis]|uniref:uncharacterized protein LOC116182929 n=1 Tax=Photinus pyralis TaxID=7054 RepID=UPI0012673615|nr:uncharacterized protein LOC116182929 [Photinus pyralis]
MNPSLEPSPTSSEASATITTGNGIPICPGNGIATTATNVGVPAGRKRPLLTGGPRTSMTPTKRTVMSLLARARAAQAKQMPATFQRGTAEFCISDALPVGWNAYEKLSSPRKIIARSSSGSILERFEFLS